MRIERGTARGVRESDTSGWVIGYFASDLGSTTAFEVKLWEYTHDIEYPSKIFHGKELIVVYGGILRIILEKNKEREELVLYGENQEYIILEPGITKRVVPISVPVFGFTVRWPSNPCMNEIVL